MDLVDFLIFIAAIGWAVWARRLWLMHTPPEDPVHWWLDKPTMANN